VAEAAPGPVIGAHEGAIQTLSWHPSEPRVLTGSDDGTLKLWRLPVTPPRFVEGHTEAVNAVAVSADGSWIATGGADGQVRLVQAETAGTENQQARVLSDQAGPVTALAFNADDSAVVSGNATGAVTAWKAASEDSDESEEDTSAFEFQAHTGSVTGIAAWPAADTESDSADTASDEDTPGTPALATTGEDGTLRIWNRLALQMRRVLFFQQSSPRASEPVTDTTDTYLLADASGYGLDCGRRPGQVSEFPEAKSRSSP